MTKRELFPIHLQENAILVIKPTGVRIFTEFKTSQDSSISTKVERFSFLWSGYYSELLPFTTLNNRWTVGYPMERHPLRKFPQRKTPPRNTLLHQGEYMAILHVKKSTFIISPDVKKMMECRHFARSARLSRQYLPNVFFRFKN